MPSIHLLLPCLLVSSSWAGQLGVVQAQTQQPKVIHRGAMRQVQIVSLPDSDEGRGSVATASHVFTRKPSGGLERKGSAVTLHDARSGARLGTMVVDGELLPPETFSGRVGWRFLDAGASQFVVFALGGDCVVRQFPSGEIRGRVAGVFTLLDGRVYLDAAGTRRMELLAESPTGLRRIEVDSAGQVTSDTVVSHTGVAGAFVRQFDRTILGTAMDGIATLERPWGEDALGAGVRVLDRSGAVLRSMDLPDSVPFGDKPWELDFRCAAWRSEEGFLFAFSQPKFDHAVGRVTVTDLSVAGSESLLYDGLPWDRMAPMNSLNQSDFGQCIGFVQDADGDGLADLVIGTPTHFFDLPALNLLGSEEGAVLTQFEGTFYDRVGVSVSIGPQGRRVLVGIAPPGLPEDLQRPGYACLLEVPSVLDASLSLIKRYTSVWR